jgi:hypothetical protein
MKSKGVILAPLIESGATVDDCVDALIVATDFNRIIESANAGDKEAAKELLALASTYLGSDIFGQMPPELQRYLRKALVNVALGTSADVAFNLKKNGRTRDNHRRNLFVGQWIKKHMAAGETLEGASFELTEHIKEGIGLYGTFYGFRSTPETKTLEGIYAKVRDELCRMEKHVTLKT